MITLNFDLNDHESLYLQLYNHIRGELLSGRLSPGERLPSKRALAQHLHISVVTVETAYSQLVAEGYVESRPRRGFFVQQADAGVLFPPPQPAAPAVQAIPPLEEKEEENQPAVYRYSFATGGVDTALFPFSTWARLLREVLSTQDSRLLSATPPEGIPELRREIARHLRDFRGMDVSPEQIIVGAGSEYLTTLLIQLLGREVRYGVEDPGYQKTSRILRAGGAEVIPIPLDRQGLRTDLLEAQGVGVVHVTPSHHFPLGTVMSAARRYELLHWAAGGAETDRYIIEDDYDSEFRFSGRPIPALQSLDQQGRVIYLNTFAKSLAPSLRISYMVLPFRLLARFRERLSFYACTVPSFEQYALTLFMSRGHFERHLNRTRLRYKARRDALVDAARQSGVLNRASLSGTEAGLHLLLRVENGMTEEELTRTAGERGVWLSPLSAYFHGTPPDGPPTLVLGFARMGTEDMLPAFRLLAEGWGLASTPQDKG